MGEPVKLNAHLDLRIGGLFNAGAVANGKRNHRRGRGRRIVMRRTAAAPRQAAKQHRNPCAGAEATGPTSLPFDHGTAQPHRSFGLAGQVSHQRDRVGRMQMLGQIDDGETEWLEDGDPDRVKRLRDGVGL